MSTPTSAAFAKARDAAADVIVETPYGEDADVTADDVMLVAYPIIITEVVERLRVVGARDNWPSWEVAADFVEREFT